MSSRLSQTSRNRKLRVEPREEGWVMGLRHRGGFNVDSNVLAKHVLAMGNVTWFSCSEIFDLVAQKY